MVFAEHAGLPNLYAMARFCQSKKACRHDAFFRHFCEQPQDCNGMCDNCAFSKDVVDLNVTAHAKSLIGHLRELSSAEQKTTMLQLVDSWRSRSRQTGEDSALIKDLSKEDTERMIVQLLLDGLLKEEFQHTAYATNSYIALGVSHRTFIQGQSKQKIQLEVVQGVKNKAKAKKQSGGPGVTDGNLQSSMAQMLDSLRQELAVQNGGIFPHSVLSSQHITMLCDQRPHSLNQVEEVIGKRKAQHYGTAILEAIKDYLSKKSDEAPDQTEGHWVSPKLNSTSLQPSEVSRCKHNASGPAHKQTSTEMITPDKKKDGIVPSPLVHTGNNQETCINLDSDSESETELKTVGIDKASKKNLCKKQQSDDDDDDDFTIVKRRVKRRKTNLE